MPCIFCLSITLFFRYLQNGDFRPFRDSFFAPDFDIIQEQTSILSVPERPSTVYSVFPALRPFRNGNKNPRKCTFYICEPMLCTINAANFTRKRIFPEIIVHFMRKLTFLHYIVKVCKRNYSELLKEISFQKHFIFRNLAIKPTFCIFATRYRVLTNE